MKNYTPIKAFRILGICLFISMNAFSQSYPVINLSDLMDSPDKYSSDITRSEVEEIQKLVYDLNPTIFISNAGSKIFGNEAPVNAETGVNNFQALTATNPDFNEVKLLKLKIEKPADLNSSLDLNSLSSFQNLKYVFVECTFECNLTRIKNMFSNVENVMILYIIATPQ